MRHKERTCCMFGPEQQQLHILCGAARACFLQQLLRCLPVALLHVGCQMQHLQLAALPLWRLHAKRPVRADVGLVTAEQLTASDASS